MQRVKDDIDRFLLDVSHGRLHQAVLALLQLDKPMPSSNNKICSGLRVRLISGLMTLDHISCLCCTTPWVRHKLVREGHDDCCT
eukprot:2467489-Karenia_brevis.AAC.1